MARGGVSVPKVLLRRGLGLLPSSTRAKPPTTLLPGLLPQPPPKACLGVTGAQWNLEFYLQQEMALPPPSPHHPSTKGHCRVTLPEC